MNKLQVLSKQSHPARKTSCCWMITSPSTFPFYNTYFMFARCIMSPGLSDGGSFCNLLWMLWIMCCHEENAAPAHLWLAVNSADVQASHCSWNFETRSNLSLGYEEFSYLTWVWGEWSHVWFKIGYLSYSSTKTNIQFQSKYMQIYQKIQHHVHFHPKHTQILSLGLMEVLILH